MKKKTSYRVGHIISPVGVAPHRPRSQVTKVDNRSHRIFYDSSRVDIIIPRNNRDVEKGYSWCIMLQNIPASIPDFAREFDGLFW